MKSDLYKEIWSRPWYLTSQRLDKDLTSKIKFYVRREIEEEVTMGTDDVNILVGDQLLETQ